MSEKIIQIINCREKCKNKRICKYHPAFETYTESIQTFMNGLQFLETRFGEQALQCLNYEEE